MPARRRSRRPWWAPQWSLLQLLGMVTAGAIVSAVAHYVARDRELQELATVLLVGLSICVFAFMPWWVTWIVDDWIADPVRRVNVAYGVHIATLLALALLGLVIDPDVGVMLFTCSLILWVLPFLVYFFPWRNDTLSPQRAAIRRLRTMKPKPTVAILGASADPSKFGNKSVRAHLKQGYDVYPVNPKGGEIEGLKVYASLAEIPVPLTRVSVYLPPAVGLKALDDVAAKGCEELFLNPGSDAPEVIARAEELGLDPIVACSIVAIGETPD